MFSFFKQTFTKVYQQFTQKVSSLFNRSQVDEQTLQELELLLLSADTGVGPTQQIMQQLRAQSTAGKLQTGQELRTELGNILITLLEHTRTTHAPEPGRVILLVGINGSGKTTFAGKLAHHYIRQGEKVLLVAGDTFRAAATEQLATWAQRAGVPVVVGKADQDPASVVFSACQQFKDGQYDRLIIDTAGRLQTKVNLMQELAKIKRIVGKQLPDERISTLLTIDAMLGQNSCVQAKMFHESTQVDELVLTKTDGTGKGGALLAIAQELRIPVRYVSFGEGIEQFAPFDPAAYVEGLLGERG